MIFKKQLSLFKLTERFLYMKSRKFSSFKVNLMPTSLSSTKSKYIVMPKYNPVNSSVETYASTTSSNKPTVTTATNEPNLDSTKSAQATTTDIIIQHHLEDNRAGLVEVQLNRSEAKNALSKKLIFELEIFINSVKNDSRVRCVLIRSLAPGVFCAGADLKERVKMSEKEVGPFVAKLRQTFHELSKLPVPVICAIDGAALGGGLELALACDLRIASSTAKMGLVETKLAIIPGAGGTQRLPRLIGVSKAKELIFTSKVLDGKEAEHIGLVNMSVPQNEQNDAAYKKALEVAQQIISNGPLAIQMAKIAIDSGSQVDIDSALKCEELCYSRVIPTKDRIEGLNAFKEKRQPKYIGE